MDPGTFIERERERGVMHIGVSQNPRTHWPARLLKVMNLRFSERPHLKNKEDSI